MAKAVKKKTKKIAQKATEDAMDKPEQSTIICRIVADAVISDASDSAVELNNKSCFGTLSKKKLQLSMLESLFLLEKGTITILNKRGNPMTAEKFVRQATKAEPNFFLRYAVFKDFRGRGYVIKTALKFGADFRVYDRGVKPGEDHAKWVVFPVHEASTLTWHEFSSKNRVAHSTKKRLLIGVVDDEGCPTYYEIRWVRP